MKTPLLLILLALIAAASPAAAYAGTAGFDGATFTYTAAPGESNAIVAKTTSTCGELAAPCFQFFDSPFYEIAPPPGCVADVSLGILCPVPSSVAIDAGDQLDLVTDWDGPSTIRAGDGGDVIRGTGGNDVLLGDTGGDVLIGGRDDIRLDVEVVQGGEGDDAIGGNDGANVLIGGGGADVVRGGGGDDDVGGAEGDDLVLGNEGADTVAGGGEDDVVHGGPGHDRLYGEWGEGCGLRLCVGGADQIISDDGEIDHVECGDGTDEAMLDAVDTVLFIPDCENVARTAAAPCRGLKGRTRTVCRLLERAAAPCRPLAGVKRKRCLRRAARKAAAACRSRFKGRPRAKCVRSVRRVLVKPRME
jgi:Ca2+-binding RTX toxin-like protein